MNKQECAITLVELLIAVVLLGLLVLAIQILCTFARHQLVSSDRRAQIQNEASYVLEHMAKEISKAIGDTIQPPVSITTIGGDPAIRIWVDRNQNGRRDSSPNDDEIAYRFTSTTGPPGSEYQIWYYAICRGANCNLSGSTSPVVITRHIPTGPNYNVSGNFLEIQLTACLDPDGAPNACGTIDNPQINMITRIKMPAFSTN